MLEQFSARYAIHIHYYDCVQKKETPLLSDLTGEELGLAGISTKDKDTEHEGDTQEDGWTVVRHK